MRVSTKSPLSWRECRSPKILWIIGLRSTPAKTTHAPLKTANKAVFAQKEFFCRTCRQKNKNAADRRKPLKNRFFNRLKGRTNLPFKVYVFSFFILKIALKIPPISFGLLITTIFKNTTPIQHLQRIPRIMTAIVSSAIINPEVQKCEIISPAPKATATKPNPEQPLRRILKTPPSFLLRHYTQNQENGDYLSLYVFVNSHYKQGSVFNLNRCIV